MKNGKRTISAEGRRKISEAMKLRWQKARAVKHAPPNAQHSESAATKQRVVYVFRDAPTRGLLVANGDLPEPIDVKFVD